MSKDTEGLVLGGVNRGVHVGSQLRSGGNRRLPAEKSATRVGATGTRMRYRDLNETHKALAARWLSSAAF